MPLAARITIIAGLGVFLAGAAFLLAARGPAILIDLSATATQLFCI